MKYSFLRKNGHKEGKNEYYVYGKTEFLTIFAIMKQHTPLLPLVVFLMIGIVLGSYPTTLCIVLGLLFQ